MLPFLLNYMSMYVLFQWFEVTSIELFLFAFVYSSRNINRNMYETFFHIIGCNESCMAHQN